MRFRRKPIVVEAVQWFPDPEYGRFDGDRYKNRQVGYDLFRVEYTITEVGFRGRQGWQKIKPGDWLVGGTQGEVWVVEGESFLEYYELA